MLRNLATSLFKHEHLETTYAKAKELRPVAEKMITLAKRGDLHARRRALSYLKDKAVTHHLFEDLSERYANRQGGYVRIIKKGLRKGDSGEIAIVQLMPIEEDKKKKVKIPSSGANPKEGPKKEAKSKETKSRASEEHPQTGKEAEDAVADDKEPKNQA
jgi:large subunit ribosomal protein L17